MKIGRRIAVGFVAVLALTLAVAFVGWNSLGTYAGRVGTANQTTELRNALGAIRLDEARFLIDGDADAVARATAEIAALRAAAEELRAELAGTEGARRIEAVVAALDRYEAALANVAAEERSKRARADALTRRAAELARSAGAIGDRQSTRAEAAGTRYAAASQALDAGLSTADSADRLIALVERARRAEATFQTTRLPEAAERVHEAIAGVFATAVRLRRSLGGDGSAVTAEIGRAAQDYRTAFEALVAAVAAEEAAHADQRKTGAKMQIAGRRFVEIATELESELRARADSARAAPAFDAPMSDAATGTLAAAANQAGAMAKLGLGALIAQQSYLLTGEAEQAEAVTAAVGDIFRAALSLKRDLGDSDAVDYVARLTKTAQAYRAGFASLIEAVDTAAAADAEAARLSDELAQHAEAVQALAERIQQEQAARYAAASADAAAAQSEFETALALRVTALRLIQAAQDADRAGKAYLLNAGADAVAAVGTATAAVRSLAGEAETMVTDGEDRTMVEGIAAAADAFDADFAALVESTEAQAAARRDMAAAAEEVGSQTAEAATALGADMERGRTQANTVIVAGTVVALLMGAALAFLIGRGITRPLDAITRAMGRLAEGDLATDVPGKERKDEIRDIAAAVQVFKDNALEMQRIKAEQEAARAQAEEEKRSAMNALADSFDASVSAVVRAVSEAANGVSSDADTMAGVAKDTMERSLAVASASDQATANVQTVAAAAEELSNSITELTRQVADSSRMASDAATEAGRTNRSVEGLATSAQKIGEVVKLITDIAEQTNLLALNATIEAARAGEAGKGFAVVASEVKNLANQTAKATEEIAQQIGEMRSATQEAVGAIQGIGATVVRISEAITGISAAIEEQGAATGEIARNVQEAAQGTQTVSENIGRVTEATGSTGDTASKMAAAAKRLTEQVAELSHEAQGFLDKVRAA